MYIAYVVNTMYNGRREAVLMPAEMTVTVTQARKSMSQFVDEVLHDKPAMYVRRGKREGFWAVAGEQFEHILRAYRFTMEYEVDEDGRYYGSIEQIPDIIGEGDTLEDLRRDLAQYLIEYSEGYAAEWKLFFNAPNRREHFPYIMHVLTQESIEDVASLIDT